MALFRFVEPEYQKNLQCLQDAMDQLMSHMKGYGWSFRREITDEKGNFSQEKLCGLVDEMLSLWAQDLRNGRYEDVSEPHLKARLELYRLYLYLVMRCSLCKGAYSDARNGAEVKEQTDFAFLLEQARQLSQAWCVIAGPDGKRRNELYWGYDAYFGFHLYRPFREFLDGSSFRGIDRSLTPDYMRACDLPLRLMTDEGNTKPISFKRLSKGPLTRPPQAEEPEEEEEQVSPDEDDCDGYDDYDPLEDDDFWDYWSVDDDFRRAELERLSEEESRNYGLTLLCTDFECVSEYFSACEDFQKLFGQAAPEVLRDFYTDLEKIVDLYLLKREIPPLMDTDKALNVYNRICDGALRQAKRYGRGIQWKGL